jgi:GrpB-like predicted nucleotidyltransferase (UPF0157 family)
MKIYKFRRYNKKYPIIFEEERKELQTIIPDAKIEHIGSTSVKGLGGKGVIDIIVGIKKGNMENTKQKLINQGYEHEKSGSKKDRLFFTKEKGIWKKRRFHIHLTKYNSTIWHQALKFKNHIIENKKTQKEYAKLKKHAIKLCKGNGKIYRECKNDYIQNILKNLR